MTKKEKEQEKTSIYNDKRYITKRSGEIFFFTQFLAIDFDSFLRRNNELESQVITISLMQFFVLQQHENLEMIFNFTHWDIWIFNKPLKAGINIFKFLKSKRLIFKNLDAE